MIGIAIAQKFWEEQNERNKPYEPSEEQKKSG